jgi:hypothetical protein
LSISIAYTGGYFQGEIMVRRSSRIKLAMEAAMKTAIDAERKYEKRPTPPPAPPPTHSSVLRDANGYLQRIYTAADQIYRRGGTKPRTPHLVNEIIIRARCARVLTHLSDEGRAAYLTVIATTKPSLSGRAQVIAEHMERLGRENIDRQRFSAFVDRFGLLLLTICAHSKSFRFILLSAHLGNRNPALWGDLCNLIESHAYSIELYARTRGLDWNTPLTETSDEWDQLICQSLYDVLEEHSTFTETQVLGISDTEYRIRHELPDIIGHYHDWVVSSDPRTAYNPEITYRIGKGKSPKSVTERQVTIDSSVVLDKPVWVNRSQWPIDDPRYRGPHSDPCELCPEDINDRKLAVEYCNHTLAELCRINHSKIAKASSRVELLQYPGKGIGVRALKAFRKDEILAEYVGEIYPEYVVRKDSRSKVQLYPNDAGIDYRFHQKMEPRNVNDDGETRKTPSPGKECDSMLIDPAIRGNWARYMNHSCREATQFEYRFVGNKKLTLIVACRDIRFGEEITVDYGAEFWKVRHYGCACGEDQCKLWDAEKNKAKGGNTVTWAEEKERLRFEREEAAEKAGNQQENGRSDTSKKSTARGKKEQARKSSEQKLNRTKRKIGGDESNGLPVKKTKRSVGNTQ